MKTIRILETVDEILDAFYDVRKEGDSSLYIPPPIFLVNEGGRLYLDGTEDINIEISDKVKWGELCIAALKRLKVRME